VLLDFIFGCMIKGVRFIILILLLSPLLATAEVSSWECSKFEGAKIIADDGTELGEIGPKWKTDSIFNESSQYSSTWSYQSIFNAHSNYGNSYSSESVFNDSATNPPKIISEEGNEIGKLSIGPSWDSTRYNPYDIKYTCDWD